MQLSYQTITWGGVVGHPVGVTSIKGLFYLANGSTEAATCDIAAAGYAGAPGGAARESLHCLEPQLAAPAPNGPGGLA
jgi:hypothetical protein